MGDFNKDFQNKLEKFDETISSRRKELQEQEIQEKQREVMLPEKVYHVTTKQKAQQIIQEGLNPTKLIFEDKEVVCLSDDVNFAMNVASVTQNVAPQNLVVLEIDTQYLMPSRVHNYLRKADFDNSRSLDAAPIHEIHYDSIITPEAIKIIKIDNKK